MMVPRVDGAELAFYYYSMTITTLMLYYLLHVVSRAHGLVERFALSSCILYHSTLEVSCKYRTFCCYYNRVYYVCIYAYSDYI